MTPRRWITRRAAWSAALVVLVVLALMPGTAAAVAPIPQFHIVPSVIRIHGRDALLLKSISVYGVRGRMIRVSCNKCPRLLTQTHSSFPTPDVKLYQDVNWELLPGKAVLIDLYRAGEIGRYLLLSAHLGGHPGLLFKSAGCIRSPKQIVPCPRGTRSPTPGSQVPQQAPVIHFLSLVYGGSGGGQIRATGAGRVPALDKCPNPLGADRTCVVAYMEGTVVTLTATASAGSMFTGWSGACHGAGACVPGIGGDLTITANFTLIIHYVNVSYAGNGSGGFNDSPAGRVPASDKCPNPLPIGGVCSLAYVEGSVVTLTATPAAGTTFSGWSGACTGTGTCTLTITGDVSVTDTLTPITHVLGVSFGGNGYGGATPSGGVRAPTRDMCAHPLPAGGVCSLGYNEGSVVTLTATPDAGSTFAGWTGACSGTGTCTVTITGDLRVGASFTLNPPPPA